MESIEANIPWMLWDIIYIYICLLKWFLVCVSFLKINNQGGWCSDVISRSWKKNAQLVNSLSGKGKIFRKWKDSKYGNREECHEKTPQIIRQGVLWCKNFETDSKFKFYQPKVFFTFLKTTITMTTSSYIFEKKIIWTKCSSSRSWFCLWPSWNSFQAFFYVKTRVSSPKTG